MGLDDDAVDYGGGGVCDYLWCASMGTLGAVGVGDRYLCSGV